MPPKVFTTPNVRDAKSQIRSPQILDLPVLTSGGTKSVLRPFMNCDGFSVGAAIGGETADENRQIIVIQMVLGESGLFQLLSIEEAEDLKNRLGRLINDIKSTGDFDSFVKKHEKREIPLEDEDE